jgi:hypothetical protein
MVLFEINPFDVHFGDQVLENNWRNTDTLSKDLILNVVLMGIVDPIIVYLVNGDKVLINQITSQKQYKKSRLEPTGFYCWRGTQRLRLARLLGYKTIKALLLDEDKETPPSLEEMQKYFKKEIKIFIEPLLQRWDVLGMEETDAGAGIGVIVSCRNVIY